MSYGWEGNRRSGFTVAMRRRLKWIIHLQAHLLVGYGTFTSRRGVYTPLISEYTPPGSV